MEQALRKPGMMAKQDQRIAEAVDRDQARLRNFIRRRVADRDDAEDVLQDVFYELVEAYRMLNPVEHVTAWLFRVARNRITDLFRRKEREASRSEPATVPDGEMLQLEELLASARTHRNGKREVAAAIEQKLQRAGALIAKRLDRVNRDRAHPRPQFA